ncbi:MAG: MAPEG family protein [Pseudomonadota bacterium]
MLTATYAAALALGFVALSLRTIALRRRSGVALGGGDSPALERAMRAHGNFAEYVPLALILIVLLELRDGAGMTIHLLCGVLIAGRVSHALAVSRIDEPVRLRVLGMVLTLGVLISASTRLLLG